MFAHGRFLCTIFSYITNPRVWSVWAGRSVQCRQPRTICTAVLWHAYIPTSFNAKVALMKQNGEANQYRWEHFRRYFEKAYFENSCNFLGTCTSLFLLLFPGLTDTVEEFEDSITQKKMKIPKMSTKNSGNSIENNFGEERMPLRHKKVGRSEVHCGCWALQQTYVSAAMHTYCIIYTVNHV